MKRWMVLSAVAIVVLSAGAYWALHFYQVREYQLAHAETLDALRRAYDYRDAGVLLFEPRWKDFQVADDRQRRLSSVGWREQAAAEMLHICGDDLKMYRGEGDDASEALLDAQDASPGSSRETFANNAEGFIESRKSIEKEIEHDCPMDH